MSGIQDDIARAKRALPLPELLRDHYRLGDLTKGDSRSPFRNGDNDHCFGIFQTRGGAWNWKDQVTGDFGDEIDFIARYEQRSPEDARLKYFELAGVKPGEGSSSGAGKSRFQELMKKPRRVAAAETAPEPATEPPAGPEAQPESAAPISPKPGFDWPACVAALDDAAVAEIAAWRGLSEDFLMSLRGHSMIGMFTPWPPGARPAVAFPVHAGGQVIGCHWRLDAHNAALFTEIEKNRGKGRVFEAGSWMYSKGAKTAPMVIGELESASEVFLFESQWDAMAVADRLGWHEGRMDGVAMIITRGAGNGGLVAGMIPDGAKVVAWPQNDQPTRKGDVPSEKWMHDVKRAADRPIRRVDVPKEHADANDWLRAGIDAKALWEAIVSAGDPELSGVVISSFRAALAFDPKNDPNCILGNRWICRSGSALWIGQSGIGKSSLMIQAAILWGLGRDLFGIRPVRPLRSLVIQAENDEGDVAEMIQGVCKAMTDAGPDSKDQMVETLEKQVILARDTIHTSADFAKIAGKLVDRYKPDLVWGDPLLSYAGDDIMQQKVASQFLRNLLNPVAFNTGIAWMMLHHTGKPNADSKAKAHWKESDHSYIGLGSSELTNWARAVNVLASSAHDGIYKLMLPKRGTRAGMRGPSGAATTKIHLEHAKYPQIYWNQVEEPESAAKEKTGHFRPHYEADDILKEMSALDPMKASDLQKRCKEELGMSEKTFYRLWGGIKKRDLVKAQDGEGWVRK